MGNSDSKNEEQNHPESHQIQEVPSDPLISRLRRAFHLEFMKNAPKMTQSFLFGAFAQQIVRPNASKIQANNSPFCYAFIRDVKLKQQLVITCALISPIVAISPSKYICDEKGFVFQSTLTLKCCLNKVWIDKKTTKILSIQDGKLALLFLEQPIWQLGWCGLTYLQQSSQVNQMPFFRIKNQVQKKQGQKKPASRVVQTISRVYFKDLQNFKAKALKQEESIIFKIHQRKSYILGIQNGEDCVFFDCYTLKDLQNQANQFLSLQRQRQYLKMIDLQQMEIQTIW